MSFRLFFLFILTTLVLGGCSKYMPNLDKVLPDQRKAYQKSKSLPDLEVPPDLTTEPIDDTLSVPDVDSNGSATFSTYQERVSRQKRNRQFANVADAPGIAELSGEQLIIVPGSASDTWVSLQEFWINQGYSLDLNDEELGIIETDWDGDATDQKRNKFKIFIEAEESGETAIYLSHLGEDYNQGSWNKRDRDLALERNMASRIRSSLNGSVPSSAPATTLTTERDLPQTEPPVGDTIYSELINAGKDKTYLTVTSDIEPLWQTVGQILNDASNISVEDESLSKGTYDILYKVDEGENAGILSKLAFWKGGDQELQISLTEIGTKTEIIVLDEDGKWETSALAEKILKQIQASL